MRRESEFYPAGKAVATVKSGRRHEDHEVIVNWALLVSVRRSCFPNFKASTWP